jgi:putative transposase
MPHSFASLLVHVIFSTKNRLPVLSPELAGRLFAYMGGIIRERRCVPLIINGPADHVHLLVSLPATESIAELLRVVKTNSSRWVHEQFPAHKRFAWQAGYAAFTVSGSRAADVRAYVVGAARASSPRAVPGGVSVILAEAWLGIR